jgi:RHS repeat-associated protein
MMNGVGGETHLVYAAASDFAHNRIPFPYWAVVRRDVRDGVTNSAALSSIYRYAGGLWEGAAREFRGFQHVWETDAGGTTVTTEFHQDERLQGLTLESKVLGPAPCPTTDPMNEDEPCSPLHDRLRTDTTAWSLIGPILLEARLSTPYYHDVPMAELSRLTGYDYDQYGNVVRESVYSPSTGTVETTTTYAYSLADEAGGWPGRYLVDKPVHTKTSSMGPSGRMLSEKMFAYDAPAPVTGLLTRAVTCIDWSAGACMRTSTLAYKHDKAGNVTTVVGPRGGATGNEYDAQLLYARSVRNAAGHVTQSVHDLRNGRETLKRGPDGRVFETLYDGLGRPVRSWSDGFTSSQPEVLATYTNGVPNGSPGWVRTRENGSPPVVVFFDGLGRELATKSIAETVSGNRTIVQGMKLYDAVGRVTAQSVPFPARDARIEVLEATPADAPGWTRYVYDARGRVTQTILPDGTRTLHDSSKPGVRVTVYANLAAATHPGKADIELLDGLDRVWRKDECSAAPAAANLGACRSGTLIGRTDFEYDSLDRPIRITSGAHTTDPAVTLADYDGLGNRTTFTSSDLGEWRYEYDVEGLLTKAVDPRGIAVFNDYDSIGRLRRQRTQDFDARYSYYRRDAGTGLVRRIRTRSGTAQIGKEFVYDARGRVVREDLRMRADGPSFENTTLYEYDDADRRVSVTYPSERSGHSRTVVTTYSAYGHPLALTAYDDGVETSIVRDIGYDLLGNTRVVQYGNGLSDVFGYAAAERLGRLECLRTTRDLTPSPTCTSDPQDERRLAIGARDAAGNILSIGDYRHTTSSPLRDDHTFGYDSFGRLTATSTTGSGNQTYAYDVHGNVSAGQNGLYAYAAGAPHRPTIGSDQIIEHDAAGNRTRKGAWRYTYDALGRLSEVHHNGALQERAFYDEGRTRIARFDPDGDSLRYYVGGLFEVEGSTLVRHYWLGGRIVASDVVPAPDHMRAAVVASVGAQVDPTSAASAGAKGVTPGYGELDGDDASTALAAALTLCLLVFVLAAATAGASGSGVALVTALTFVVATTPFPALARPATSADAVGAAALLGPAASHRRDLTHAVTTGTRTFFYHPDHVGSPYMVSDASGTIVEHRRYDAYGGLRRVLNDQGSPLADTASDVSFTGQLGDDDSGLIYFGSRYYDAELGLFLTPDPQAQFASPYLYGGGNPVNGVDPDGEFLDVLAAILVPILVSAAVSAVVSGVVAALQGGDFLQAFGSGFVGGLIGGALGTVLGTLNVAYQFFAGGAQYIQAAEALQAVVDVASRSAFTNAVSQSAVSVADAAGLSSDWVTAISVVTPLLASYSYDNYIIKDSGAASGIGSSQRELAKAGVQNVNTSVGHTNITEQAAQGTGWERNAGELVKYNLAEDGPAPTGCAVREFFGKARALLTNQEHFGRLPSTIKGIGARVSPVLEGIDNAAPSAARDADLFMPYRQAVGAATHYVQDHLTLGHMVPGTRIFAGPVAAPVRFVIHQVFGGEIAFRNAQIRATHTFLTRFGMAT